MRDQDASLFAGIVRITWRRVVRDAGLLRPGGEFVHPALIEAQAQHKNLFDRKGLG
jgi:hypothetical protein